MFKQVVYVEKQMVKQSTTQSVLDIIQPSEIIVINDYKEVLNQTNSHWLFNKAYQKIILAKRKNEFYYKGSALTSNIGHRYFYYNTLALNCLYHCEYCYLQGMYNTPHLVLFLNNHDFIKATRQLIRQLKNKIYLALSYDTDLPALEKYYPYCKEWIEFAGKEKNITIEIRTKSNQLSFIENAKVSENVILSFTLSPEQIQKKYEPFTPSLEQRLKAVKMAMDKGFQVMLCFDPLIITPEFQLIYTQFFENIFSKITPSSRISASIGTFRMNNDFLKRIRKNGNTSDIYLYPYEIKNKIATYPHPVRQEMITFVKSELEKRNIRNLYIYE
ncbi:MAG: DNA photolyase [Bacteroidetes bacterium]|nr:MAG: DNA photolyase [Bacteroidota bacterium]